MRTLLTNPLVAILAAFLLAMLWAVHLAPCQWCTKQVGWLPRVRRFGGGWWLQCGACSRRARAFRELDDNRRRAEQEMPGETPEQAMTRELSEKYGVR